MSSKETKFALIGCGAIAKKHMLALGRIDDAKVVAICDIDVNAAKDFGAKYKVQHFTDPHQMFKEVNIDVIDILTPTGLHGKVALDLIKYNKHIVVEKPLALKLDEIDKILEESDKRGIKLFVVQQNRFNPPIKLLKDALNKNLFGKPVLGTVRVRWTRTQSYYDEKKWRGTWAMDGGVLANQASHHIDMLLWMLGDVESVFAKTATQLTKIETEDTAVAVLKFTSGALGIIEATTATRPKDLEGSISILGEKGTAVVGGFFMNKMDVWNLSSQDLSSEQIKKQFETPEMPAWNHTEYLKDVIYSIKNNTRGLVDGFEGRRSVELITALYESAESGKEVVLRFKPSRSKLGMSDENIKKSSNK